MNIKGFQFKACEKQNVGPGFAALKKFEIMVNKSCNFLKFETFVIEL